MKTIFTLFVLLFSSSVFARTIIIDCDVKNSYKVTADDKVWYKNRSTDFKWKNTDSSINDNLFQKSFQWCKELQKIKSSHISYSSSLPENEYYSLWSNF